MQVLGVEADGFCRKRWRREIFAAMCGAVAAAVVVVVVKSEVEGAEGEGFVSPVTSRG